LEEVDWDATRRKNKGKKRVGPIEGLSENSKRAVALIRSTGGVKQLKKPSKNLYSPTPKGKKR